MNSRTKRNGLIATMALAAAVTLAPAQAQTAPAKPASKVAGPAKPLPKGAYQLKLVDIPDPTGRMKSRIAARALVPAGWTAQGGVIWPPESVQECADYATYAWAATSPDGKSRFELVPTQLWAASNTTQGPCTYGEFQDMQSYLRAHVQQRVRGATGFQYRARPDLLEPQRADIEFQTRLMQGSPARFWADGGELSFTYTENGVKMKGVVGGTARFYMNQLYNPLGGAPLTSLSASTNYAYAASFPADSFDPQLVEAMRKSVKPDYTWLTNYSDFKLQMLTQKTGFVRERSDQIVAAGYALTQATIKRNQAAANAAVAKTYADAPLSTSKSDDDDRQQRERIESIRGVETYDDPVYGGTVQLDNTYDHAWRVNNNDSYILTNDPNFNPGLYNIDAQQLKVTR